MVNCLNPECSLEIPERKVRIYKPKYCSQQCYLQHRAILRGKCTNQACANYVPVSGMKYCSDACYMAVNYVQRQYCVIPGCNRIPARARSKYCSVEHRNQGMLHNQNALHRVMRHQV